MLPASIEFRESCEWPQTPLLASYFLFIFLHLIFMVFLFLFFFFLFSSFFEIFSQLKIHFYLPL